MKSKKKKKKNFKNKLNRIILGAAEKRSVTDRIAPSYTSQSQKWKGAEPTLNNKVTNIKTKPKKCIGSKIEKSNENNASNDVEPTAEYKKQRPKSKKLEITAPKMKYFKPASVENSELRWNVAKM